MERLEIAAWQPFFLLKCRGFPLKRTVRIRKLMVGRRSFHFGGPGPIFKVLLLLVFGDRTLLSFRCSLCWCLDFCPTIFLTYLRLLTKSSNIWTHVQPCYTKSYMDIFLPNHLTYAFNEPDISRHIWGYLPNGSRVGRSLSLRCWRRLVSPMRKWLQEMTAFLGGVSWGWPFFVVRKAQGTTPAFHHYAPLEPGYAAIRGEGSSEGWKSMMQENQKWNCLMKARNFLKRIKQHFCNTSWLLVAESFSPEQRLFMRWCAQAPLSLSFVKLGNLTNLQVGLGHGRFFDEVKEPRNDTTNDCV